jgi:hypothetical protein
VRFAVITIVVPACVGAPTPRNPTFVVANR